MAMVRWEPVAALGMLQRDLNRMLGSFPDLGGDASMRWMPPMDLYEEDDQFVLCADLPGMSEQDISLEVEDEVLTISGERLNEREQRDESGGYRMERAFGSFARSLVLPSGVDPDSIEASFDKGVLEVRIPKPQERQPRRINVGKGSRQIEGDTAGRHSGG